MTYAADFIEELASRGITQGSPVCSGAAGPPYGTYCPDDATSRADLAEFLLLSTEGPGYAPPDCNMVDPRVFTDVPWDHPACKYIEDAAIKGLVFGSRVCSTEPGPPFATYCPDAPVSRADMSVHAVSAFNALDECVNPVNPVPATGACRLPNGTCSVLTTLDCMFFGEGMYEGDGVSCSPCGGAAGGIFCDDFEFGNDAAWSAGSP